MRILLASNASYLPPRGGSTRSNLVWLRALADAGHECRVICAAPEKGTGAEQEIRDQKLVAGEGGIKIRPVEDFARKAGALESEIAAYKPDWVLISSEDMAHSLLREADRVALGRVIYLAHTPQFMPFGPESWNPEREATECVRRAAGVVAISHTVADYVREFAGAQAVVIHPPIYGKGPWRRYNAFPDGSILMINPATVKGLPIFLELARRFPDERFAVIPSWGTTSNDRAALASIPNIRVLSTVRDIEDVLVSAKLLLVPSLWLEGFGLVVMEAMLRGVPVIASDHGGLKEAKRGTGYRIPTTPIERYEGGFDERHMPRAVLPAIDLQPWIEAVAELSRDDARWKAEAALSRDVAEQFVSKLDAREFERYLLRLKPVRAGMRILLAHNSLYYPSHGGGDKSNRLLMEALAARGNQVRVVSRIEHFGAESEREYLASLAARGVAGVPRDGVVTFERKGVEVHTVTSTPNVRGHFAGEIRSFDPDVIITSTDDPAQILLDPALKADRARVVYLIRATIAAPFGPDAAFPSRAKTDVLERVDGAVGVSEYVAGYVRQWSEIPAIHVPISLLDPVTEYPMLGRFDNEFVTFVNPCAVKGLSIFLGLADAFPDVRFAAVPTWGTTAEDLESLRARPNVTVVDPVDNIDDLLRRSRVMLVPSVWAEARSRMVLESISRGVPVMAADSGGLKEAMCGVPYLLPVRTVTRYLHRVDDHMVPVAEVPPQDLGPWKAVLQRLTTDRKHWEEISAQSRQAAMRYVENLSAAPFENYLRELVSRPKRTVKAARQARQRPSIEHFSADKRRLLALRIRQRSSGQSDPWLVGIEQAPRDAKLLFCFPHAGGGTTQYRAWRDGLPPDVAIVPVRLPGRESRASEPPFDSMSTLVESLGAVLKPHLGRRFAFFGHSMGAVVGFELARWLRSKGMPQPEALFASAARAPQFRLNHVPGPEPSEPDFMAELRRLDGLPKDAIENPELLSAILPALRADAGLYRRYIYEPGEPLDIKIAAMGGTADPNVTKEHLLAWSDQTTREFSLHEFNGGHFYLQNQAKGVASVIAKLLD